MHGGRTKRFFFSQEEGWPLPEKMSEGDHRCYCTQSIMQKYLQQRERVGEAAADEEEEEEQQEQQEQEDTEDSGGESGDDK